MNIGMNNFWNEIAMGIINLLAVQDYWSSGLSQVSWFSAIMLVGQICQCLHFADNKKTPDRNSKEFKLYKLGNVTEPVNECSRKCYTPNQRLSIDEQMIGTKFHISYLQYMPKKLSNIYWEM